MLKDVRPLELRVLSLVFYSLCSLSIYLSLLEMNPCVNEDRRVLSHRKLVLSMPATPYGQLINNKIQSALRDRQYGSRPKPSVWRGRDMSI